MSVSVSVSECALCSIYVVCMFVWERERERVSECVCLIFAI